MANSFDVLRRLLPSSLRSQRSRSRLAVLQAAKEHLRYLEGIVSELLEDGHFPGEPESLEAVRQTFYHCSSTPSLMSGRHSQRDSEPSSQELQASLEDLQEQDPAAFTGVREPGANISADSVPSSPTLCQAWLSNRAVETAVAASPTIRSLLESFYDDSALPMHENSVVQLVPDVIAYEAVPPLDSGDDQVVPIPQVYEDLNAVVAGSVATASVEELVLRSRATMPGAKISEHLPTSESDLNAYQLSEQWISATHMEWVLNFDD
ncbi:hypothetical protein V5799_012254 [Amblyomma americanum]|uniref:BHLH domain-containing protein n=1 Tax=Amblyomma americanum TaxID=6943 RepID=A0AAQ4EEJ9_AMBAM